MHEKGEDRRVERVQEIGDTGVRYESLGRGDRVRE